MIIKKIIEILEDWAPKAYAEDFDNVGLLIGNETQECSGVLVSLDCTEAVVDEAMIKGCNLIVCFHPIIFSGLKKITGKNYVERVVIKAIQNNIGIIALHTRLDNHPEGVNDVLSKRLGLLNTRVLIPKKGSLKKLSTYVPSTHLETILEGLHEAGAGELGSYSECSFTSEGIGRFKGNEKSNPFKGNPKEKLKTEEIHVEVVFESHLNLAVQKALQDLHPYETVVVSVMIVIIGIVRHSSSSPSSSSSSLSSSSLTTSLSSSLWFRRPAPYPLGQRSVALGTTEQFVGDFLKSPARDSNPESPVP